MAIRFSCACGKEMQAQDEHAGRKTKCPGCGVELMIPGRSTQVRPPQGQKASRSSDRGVDYEDDDKIAERPARKTGRREEDAEEDRTGGRPTARTSGKAIVCLILGLMSFGCNVFTAVPAVILGFLSLRDVGAGKGRVTGKGLATTGMVIGLIGLFCNDGGIGGGFGLFKLRDASQRQASANNLKQIGLGMHNFASNTQRLPAIASQTKDGKPGLSWRVALLPYLEEDNLYRQFRLDEPWDSANNKRLLTPMPKIFAHPAASDATTASGKTHYRGFYGTGAVFDPAVTLPQRGGSPTLGVRFPNDITDGTSNTILVVEAADPIEWTRPDDLRFDPNALLPKLGVTDDGFHVLFADGSVRYIKKPVDEKMIKAAITRNGGEPVLLP
jgi:prepilin-type processing-associated H-X9-DG protein